MNVAVILAGGKGTRVGLEIPKQYYEVNGKAVISYCLHTFLTHEEIDVVQIVADEMWRGYIMQQLFRLPYNAKFREFSAPGENRQLSIYNALVDIRGYALENDTVVIHDAARPCVSAAQIADCLKAAKGHDGTLPVLPMKDAMRRAQPDKDGVCVVCGLGTIGMLLLTFLKDVGVRNIITVGNKDFQRQTVAKLGLTEDCYCDSRTEDVLKMGYGSYG